MRKKKNDLVPRVRIWLQSKDGDGAFGDGKIGLLEAIGELGSLQAAARELGISYRKAWGDLKKIEACFPRPLLDKSRGGADGGRTTLTAEGRALIEAYLAFRRKVDDAVMKSFEDFEKAL